MLNTVEIKHDLYQENIKVYFITYTEDEDTARFIYTFDESIINKAKEAYELGYVLAGCYEGCVHETTSYDLKSKISELIKEKYQTDQRTIQYNQLKDDVQSILVGGLKNDGTRNTLCNYVPSFFIDEITSNLLNKGYKKEVVGKWIKVDRHRGGFRTVTVTDYFGEQHSGTVDERHISPEYYCSVCGKIAHESFLAYCASCGSRMELDESDNQNTKEE